MPRPLNIKGDKFTDLFERLAYDFIRCDPNVEEYLDSDLIIPTIYFLTDLSGQIQYIGQTKQLALRLAQHRANPKMRQRISWDRTFYITPGIESKSDRLRFEAALIAIISPPGNKVILMRHLKNGSWSEVRWKSGKSPFKRIKFTRGKKK